MYISLHVKYPSHLFKNTQISNFMKICPMGAEMFHADRWTDMTKLIIALCNFANAPTRPKQEHMD
jgi:hypothetical protein